MAARADSANSLSQGSKRRTAPPPRQPGTSTTRQAAFLDAVLSILVV